jgi:hypothetical protein
MAKGRRGVNLPQGPDTLSLEALRIKQINNRVTGWKQSKDEWCQATYSNPEAYYNPARNKCCYRDVGCVFELEKHSS